MNDSDFTRLLGRLGKAGNKYGELLKRAEAEYVRRYGSNPSDEDDDQWIDCFHLAGSCSENVSAQTVEGFAKGVGLKRINK